MVIWGRLSDGVETLENGGAKRSIDQLLDPSSSYFESQIRKWPERRKQELLLTCVNQLPITGALGAE